MADYYVDATLDSNSGDGTIGNPFGDLQFGFDSTSLVAVGQDDWWLHGEEVLAATLNRGVHASTSHSRRQVVYSWDGVNAQTRGYGSINGGGNRIVSATQGFSLDSLELHNGGSSYLAIGFSGYTSGLINCYLHDCVGGVSATANASFLYGCRIEDVGGYGATGFGKVFGNYFANGTKKFSTAIHPASTYPTIVRNNILVLDGASQGIMAYIYGEVWNNSLLSVGATGAAKGIYTAGNGCSIGNNVIEGFITGVHVVSGSRADYYGNNYCFGNTTDYQIDDVTIDMGDNEIGGATAFEKSGAASYANRLSYFSPADIGNARSGVYGLAKGALPAPAGGSGSLGFPCNFNGGFED